MKAIACKPALKLCAMTLAVCAASATQAVENGVTNWPNGVNTALPALMPPPGETQLYGYTVFYTADDYKDSHGKSTPGTFDLDVFVQAFRINHTWDYRSESGVTFTTGAILSGGRNSLDVGVADDSETGLNQLYFTPLYINWSASESLHFATGFSAFIPLGDYDRGNLINTTSNTYSYVQEFDMTWFPTPQWELSLSPTITVNFENDDTDYESGDVFNVDYFAGYRPASAPQWQGGLAGHYTRQVSDDSLNGRTVGDGNRIQKLAFGPQVFYGIGDRTAVLVKYLHETNVKNGPEGDSLWFQFTMPL